MYSLEQLDITCNVVSAEVQIFNLVVCLEADHELHKALRSNVVGMQIKELELHFLLDEKLGEVMHTLVVQFAA